MKPKHVLSWIAMIVLLGVVGLACETGDDEGESSDNGDDSDDEYCEVVSDEEYACLDECEADAEACYPECEYVSPPEKGPCQEACQTTHTDCKDECDETYEDLSCPDEGPGPADNPTVDDDDDDEGDDDSSGP